MLHSILVMTNANNTPAETSDTMTNSAHVFNSPEAHAAQKVLDDARREARWAAEDARREESHRRVMSGEADAEQAAYEKRLARINNAMTCNGGTY